MRVKRFFEKSFKNGKSSRKATRRAAHVLECGGKRADSALAYAHECTERLRLWHAEAKAPSSLRSVGALHKRTLCWSCDKRRAAFARRRMGCAGEALHRGRDTSVPDFSSIKWILLLSQERRKALDSLSAILRKAGSAGTELLSKRSSAFPINHGESFAFVHCETMKSSDWRSAGSIDTLAVAASILT